MCDAKNPPDSDFVSVSALILFILYILVITWDLLYRLWMSWKYEYQPSRCTILGNACNCHFSLGIFIFLIKITPIGGFEQFTAGLVLSLVPELLTGAGVHHVQFFFKFDDIFALATLLLGCDCFLPSFILHFKFLQTTVLQYHHFTVWSTEFGSLLDRKSHKSTSFEQETTIGLFTNCIFINIWHFISILKHFCINFLSEIENSESSTKHCFWQRPFCL